MTRCKRCESYQVRWVGHSKFAHHEYISGNRDVQQCFDCGLVWRYARTGRRLRVSRYRVWQNDA